MKARKKYIKISKKECRGPDLNQRHLDLQSSVLPTELPRQWAERDSNS